MNIAFVGCGFVADYYRSTLAGHPELELLGVFDRDADRARRFSVFHSTHRYESLADLLADDRVNMVLNLTNPRDHYSVTKTCLEAGKHVYSEKPLAMELDQARELVELAERLGLGLSSAPCSLLGETAQTLWKALRENVVGKVRLAYAEMDDGMVHQMPYRKWLSASGIPWPAKDEFEVGCTFEHAGYYLTWFPAFFGPAESVTAFSACLIPDKGTDEPLDSVAPDFSVACITFASGVVVRLTCGIVAPHDHTLKIIADGGLLGIEDCWFYRTPVYIKRLMTIRRSSFLTPWKRRYPMVGKNLGILTSRGAQQMDFMRGPAELAASIRERRPCRLSARYVLHTNEMVIAIDHARQNGCTYRMTTTFDPIEPMSWAQ